ncbi:MAG: protein-L-isoaspartate O-methyltransferase family protein [Brevirhabdus sp.]
MNYTQRRTMMVDTQVRPSDVTKFPIIEAMLAIPREAYVPDTQRELAYLGENVDLGAGRVLLEPRTMGKMLDALDIQPGETVLDLGSGLGYSAALLAHLAEAVVAVEENGMAEDAQANLLAQGVDNAAVIEGRIAEGAPKHGPYDVIVIEGGVEDVPQVLLDQLKDGGRISALFMNAGLGEVRIGHKLDGKLTWRFAFNAAAPVLDGFAKKPEFSF